MLKGKQRSKWLRRQRFSVAEYRERHRKVFDALLRGLSNVAVARECGISPRRVSQIMERGGIRRTVTLHGF